MKIRSSFVTNSSSSCFVVNLSEIDVQKKEAYKKLITCCCKSVTVAEIMKMYNNDCDFDQLYYLVDYSGGDIMHVWVSYDAGRYNPQLDDILCEYDSDIECPKIDLDI
ncbi:MAG: hypothetical protein H6Q73_1145 [Firmicutes bacterium]|nr:hypothetical protein [Bacillota bacterium]